MIRFSVTSSFLMKMVFDEPKKRCHGLYDFAMNERAIGESEFMPFGGSS